MSKWRKVSPDQIKIRRIETQRCLLLNANCGETQGYLDWREITEPGDTIQTLFLTEATDD